MLCVCDVQGRVSVERLSVALTGRAKSILGGIEQFIRINFYLHVHVVKDR